MRITECVYVYCHLVTLGNFVISQLSFFFLFFFVSFRIGFLRLWPFTFRLLPFSCCLSADVDVICNMCAAMLPRYIPVYLCMSSMYLILCGNLRQNYMVVSRKKKKTRHCHWPRNARPNIRHCLRRLELGSHHCIILPQLSHTHSLVSSLHWPFVLVSCSFPFLLSIYFQFQYYQSRTQHGAVVPAVPAPGVSLGGTGLSPFIFVLLRLG